MKQTHLTQKIDTGLKICPECRKEIPAHLQFCWSCGEPTDKEVE